MSASARPTPPDDAGRSPSRSVGKGDSVSAGGSVPNADRRQVDFDKLTPMMQHYVEVKNQNPQALLLYRVGDFFETFFEDACTIAEVLELVLTSKEGGKEIGRVPMAGIPHHAIERYCAQLVEKGYAVAICDQTEEASQAQGNLVRREVTRILTPGTLVEDGMLAARRNNYLAAAVVARNQWGLAYADVSTGEFQTTQSADLEQLGQELLRLQPSEVLFPVNAPDLTGLLRPGESRDRLNQRGAKLPDELPTQFCYALRPQGSFELAEARQRLLDRFRLRSLEGLGCDRLPLAVRAAGALLAYVEETFRGRRDGRDRPQTLPLQMPKTYAIADYLVVDAQSRRNLEIVQTVRDGTLNGSLLWALDRTATAMGSRLLRRWLLQPLLDRAAIEGRLDTVQELVADGELRQDLRDLLRQIYDLERLAGRAGAGTANARDLVALAESCDRLPDLAARLEPATSPHLRALHDPPPELERLGDRLRSHLVEAPPLHLTNGGLIRPGARPDLDRLRDQSAGDRDWLATLETRERQRTGIPTLKVGYNKTFGYYIGVSRAKADLVPEDYLRKQTLVNEERYITPELKEREARILSAQEDLNRLEYEIFAELRDEAGRLADCLRAVAAKVAAADVLANFAELAVLRDYCRPTIAEGREIRIEAGRHPVVEASLPQGLFVPNDTRLGAIGLTSGDLVSGDLASGDLASGDLASGDLVSGDLVSGEPMAVPAESVADSGSSKPNDADRDRAARNDAARNDAACNDVDRNDNDVARNNADRDDAAPETPEPDAPDLIVLTGPNASGKSCYLRQVGLIQLLAQTGSFVPARSARLGICDRVFTRVGAVDDLATGQSTFMVEMNETANILNHAGDRALVLLDEIGRGTATFDGLAIAWAVAEYLAAELRARTIFATHYHELNELAALLPNVANYQVTVKELPDRIAFLHRVCPGGADRSYGIEAARLAGVPPAAIARARQIAAQIEKHSHIAVGLRQGRAPQPASRQNPSPEGDRSSGDPSRSAAEDTSQRRGGSVSEPRRGAGKRSRRRGDPSPMPAPALAADGEDREAARQSDIQLDIFS